MADALNPLDPIAHIAGRVALRRKGVVEEAKHRWLGDRRRSTEKLEEVAAKNATVGSVRLIELEAVLEMARSAPPLTELLHEAAARFREYERSHLAKGTPDGLAKAERNAEIAKRIEAVVGRTDPTTQADTGALSPEEADRAEKLIAMLSGEGELDGYGFGEGPPLRADGMPGPGYKRAFWWRAELPLLKRAVAAARTTSTPPIAAGADAGLSAEELDNLEEEARMMKWGNPAKRPLRRLIAAARSTASPAQVGALRLRLGEALWRYGDKIRMSNAPPHLQCEIDDAIHAYRAALAKPDAEPPAVADAAEGAR